MMMKKYLLHPYFRIIMVGAIVLLLLNSCEYGMEQGNVAQNPTVGTTTNPQAAKDKGTTGGPTNQGAEEPAAPIASEEFTERDLKYKGKQAVITKHARCRMGCREIDAFEIQEVIDQDLINYKKNKPAEGGRCASIAYEGTTRDRQHVRVIVGECDRDPIIITVIDLGNKYNCTCD
jgi:hypothetical protein